MVALMTLEAIPKIYHARKSLRLNLMVLEKKVAWPL